ncbi:MAG TPA: glycosyltransferase family 4 protein [bacterium]|nr:glycosyltransferase family 4 protein [bacterium]
MKTDSSTERLQTLQPGARVALFLNYFPALSERFIVNEVAGLLERGLDLRPYALSRPPAGRENSEVPELAQRTFYILPSLQAGKVIGAHFAWLFRHPVRYLRCWSFARRRRTRSESLLGSLWRAAHKQELTKAQRQNVLLNFFLIVPVARQMEEEGFSLIHAQYADSASSLALLASMLLEIPFSFTAHAYDIFTPQVIFEEKLKRARFIVTCTRYNRDYLLQNFGELVGDKILVNYHGLDLTRLQPVARIKQEPPVILSVGRLVPKKGLGVLLHACKILHDQGVAFKCLIVGDGPERPRLEMFIRLNHLMEQIEITGYMAPSAVIEAYGGASLFVLPCVVEEDGNRDGIPNVIAEAMAMELPVISTTISGIPELVEKGESGLLLDEAEPKLLAQTMLEVLDSPQMQRRLGRAGRARVAAIFDSRRNLDELYNFFQLRLHEIAAGEREA